MTMRADADEVVRQLEAAGVLHHARTLTVGTGAVRGRTGLLMVVELRRHPKFAEGVLYGLHRDVGSHLTDFRGFRKAFGAGSLQIVVDLRTGAFYADVDLFNPYQDAVNLVGHAAEVVASLWRRKGDDGKEART